MLFPMHTYLYCACLVMVSDRMTGSIGDTSHRPPEDTRTSDSTSHAHAVLNGMHRCLLPEWSHDSTQGDNRTTGQQDEFSV